MSISECKEIEKKIAFHSAPSLLGLKCANLISLNNTDYDIKTYADLFNYKGKQHGLRFRVLCQCKSNTLILIYNEKMLLNRLKSQKIQNFLYAYGYKNNAELNYYLNELEERVSCYKQFPHEIGAFLDYPYEDIVGYIDNKGKNYKICRYWKVYGDTTKAEETFHHYDMCRDYLCYKLNSGIDIFNAIQEVNLS